MERERIKYALLFSLTLSLHSNAFQYELNVTYWIHKPYIYTEDNKIVGTFTELMSRFKPKECGPDGLRINYVNQKATFLDLLLSLNSSYYAIANSSKTMFAILPIIPTSYIDHKLFDKHERLPILTTPGYTLATNAMTMTKIYRLMTFGFFESAPLLLMMTICNLVAGGVVWFLERKKDGGDAQFSYNYISGLWDGFWWAAVTLTTVGYGDKTPKTLAGKLTGLFWLVLSCILLAAFGAIMTSSVTTNVIPIAGRKFSGNLKINYSFDFSSIRVNSVAYIENSHAIDVIIENSAIPMAVDTAEEALELTKRMSSFGALVDTNYFTSRQDELFNDGILVDQRFHRTDENVTIWLRKSNTKNNTNKCFTEFMNFLNGMIPNLRHLRPKIKVNKYRMVHERIEPNIATAPGFVAAYCITALFIVAWLIIGVTDFIKKRRNRDKTASKIPVSFDNGSKCKDKDAFMLEQLEKINDQLADIKSWIKRAENCRCGLKKISDTTKPKIVRKSSSLCFSGSENDANNDPYTHIDEHAF